MLKGVRKEMAKDDSDTFVIIGQFKVNLDQVEKKDIVLLRSYFPKEEYRLLKNRKSARMCRIRRKEECLGSKGQIE